MVTLTMIGDDLAKARAAERAARAAARAAAVQAAAEGIPERVIARDLGVTQMAVRAWLGKGPKAHAS